MSEDALAKWDALVEAGARRLGRHHNAAIEAALETIRHEPSPPPWLARWVRRPTTYADVSRATYDDESRDFRRIAAPTAVQYRLRSLAYDRSLGPGDVIPIREAGLWVWPLESN